MFIVYKHGHCLGSFKIASLQRAKAWATENACSQWIIEDASGTIVARDES